MAIDEELLSTFMGNRTPVQVPPRVTGPPPSSNPFMVILDRIAENPDLQQSLIDFGARISQPRPEEQNFVGQLTESLAGATKTFRDLTDRTRESRRRDRTVGVEEERAKTGRIGAESQKKRVELEEERNPGLIRLNEERIATEKAERRLLGTRADAARGGGADQLTKRILDLYKQHISDSAEQMRKIKEVAQSEEEVTALMEDLDRRFEESLVNAIGVGMGPGGAQAVLERFRQVKEVIEGEKGRVRGPAVGGRDPALDAALEDLRTGTP